MRAEQTYFQTDFAIPAALLFSGGDRNLRKAFCWNTSKKAGDSLIEKRRPLPMSESMPNAGWAKVAGKRPSPVWKRKTDDPRRTKFP
ncbi:MAG: hypothetical protein C0P66_010020 [Bacillaceae bacterium]